MSNRKAYVIVILSVSLFFVAFNTNLGLSAINSLINTNTSETSKETETTIIQERSNTLTQTLNSTENITIQPITESLDSSQPTNELNSSVRTEEATIQPITESLDSSQPTNELNRPTNTEETTIQPITELSDSFQLIEDYSTLLPRTTNQGYESMDYDNFLSEISSISPGFNLDVFQNQLRESFDFFQQSFNWRDAGSLPVLSEEEINVYLEKQRELVREFASDEWAAMVTQDLKQEDINEIKNSLNEILTDHQKLIDANYDFFSGTEISLDFEKQIYEIVQDWAATEVDFEFLTITGDPRKDGLSMRELFRIKEIKPIDFYLRDDGKEVIKSLSLQGTAPANSVVSIFIYSTPIIVKTQADSHGYWHYVLEKELEDGSHEVYVASVDNTGNILAKSRPTFLVKEAAAIQFDVVPLPAVKIESLGFFDSRTFFILVAVFVLIITAAIALVGVATRKEEDL